mmetsp:Transcript_6773/g.18908  ORF Transcript_6773/g.18908 Transcript_6773/m.18908 type:complete len:201 (-) Transcript_6773:258-860(-)
MVSLIRSSAARPSSIMGTVTTSLVTAPLSKLSMGRTYSSSVMRSCSMDLTTLRAAGDRPSEVAVPNRYRRDRSRRLISARPHAAQMETALEEKADVKVMRGPNSTANAEPPPLGAVAAAVSTKTDLSRRRPDRSKVSARSHSRRSRLVADSPSVRSSSIWTLKQDSVWMDVMLAASSARPRFSSCSLMEGRRLWDGSVSR